LFLAGWPDVIVPAYPYLPSLFSADCVESVPRESIEIGRNDCLPLEFGRYTAFFWATSPISSHLSRMRIFLVSYYLCICRIVLFRHQIGWVVMFRPGYIEGVATDPKRRAWRYSSPRPLPWAAWYPSAHSSAMVDKLIGPPGEELFRMGLVAENADVSTAQDHWPVVLLSHGTGGSVEGLSWLGTYLATKGFISIGVSHHGNTIVEPYLPEGFICWWERARDLTVILSFLNNVGPLSNRLDMGNVFASGHSLGAYTVLLLAGAITNLQLFDDWLIAEGKEGGGPREFPNIGSYIPELNAQSQQFRHSMARHAQSYHDPRIKAVLTLAPAPPVRSFEPESVALIKAPTVMIVGQNDTEAPHKECAFWLKEKNPSFQLELLGRDVGHYVFLPEATATGRATDPTICSDPVGVDRHSIHRSAGEVAERHFRSATVLRT